MLVEKLSAMAFECCLEEGFLDHPKPYGAASYVLVERVGVLASEAL